MSSLDKISISGSQILVGGARIAAPRWRSLHKMPGIAPNSWDPCGISPGGYYTDLNPSDGDITETGWGGARGGLYEDTGTTDVSVEVVWSGYNNNQASPLVCMIPDDDDFGLGIWFEENLTGDRMGLQPPGQLPNGHYVLWNIGRYTSDINIATPVVYIPYLHEEGVPVTLRMDVKDGNVKSYSDDVLIFDYDLPEKFLSSTIHGMSVDTNQWNDPVKNRPCANVPYKVTAL